MTIYSPHHSNTKSNTKTVGIVGAGIVGICCALYLQRSGYKVTLIDGKGISQGCSKGNAGHFATEQVFPLADKSLLPQLPKMLLDPLGPFRIKLSYLFKAMPWFVRFLFNMQDKKVQSHTLALRSLNEKSIVAYQPLLDDADLGHLLSTKGSLLTFETTKQRQIEKLLGAFRAEGINLELLDRKQLEELEPGLDKRVKSAILFKDVAHTCDPELLSFELTKHFLKNGGEFIQQDVDLLQPHALGIEVKLKHKNLRFNKVVVATGAWSKQLVAPLGYKVPIEAERGYHLMLEQHKLLNRPVASAERKFIMTPMSAGLRLAGTVEFAGLNAKMNEKRADALLPHAKQLLPELAEHVPSGNEKWMGCRPSLPDSLPVIGHAPRHKHLYFAFGHQHLGLTQGAITGKIISELIDNKPPSVDVSPFNINRFNYSPF